MAAISDNEVFKSFCNMLKEVVLCISEIKWSKSMYMGINSDDIIIIEPWYEISNNLVCATSEGSDQPAHTRRLIRAFADRLNIL